MAETAAASPPPARSTTASRTLIGRLLYDSKAIFEDQLEAVERTSARARATSTRTWRCSPTACGPSASRASPSTSPTATSPRPSGSSSSPTRPGHIQYTRNMVTGASTADLALVLVDARNGVVEQSPAPRVHRVAAAHPAPRAVRQQDGPRRLRPRTSSRRSRTSSARSPRKLDITDLTFIPISALHGDNVVAPLREHALVRGRVAAAPPRRGAHRVRPQPHRRPVPGAVRASARMSDEYHDYRGYAGTVAGGVLKPGDEVVGAAVGLHVARIDVDRHGRRPGRRGVRADVGHDPPRPTTSTSAAAT